MILNEQTYKNLNRPYYIGRMKGYDRSKASHNNYFYLTTDLLYAIFYAGREGTIEEYRLKLPPYIHLLPYVLLLLLQRRLGQIYS